MHDFCRVLNFSRVSLFEGSMYNYEEMHAKVISYKLFTTVN